MAAEGGSGVFTFASGSKYTGEYQIQDERRVRHGRGKYVDGPETFEGQWADDKMNGTGARSGRCPEVAAANWLSPLWQGHTASRPGRCTR